LGRQAARMRRERSVSAMNIDLSGKLALVTGASGELGRVMARTLAACGADVAVHYFSNKDKAEKLASELRAKGRKSRAFQADVTREESVMALKGAVADALGSPQIIVNNAVIQGPWVPVMEQPLENWENQFRSCVLHNVFMAKAFVPAMKKEGWGRVIAINTECAVQCFPGQSAYVAGKRGLDGVLRVLARELGEFQITVNQVAPGWMISDRARDEGTEKQEGYEKSVPLKRRGTDQDVANLVAFLASDLASFITGAFVSVSGGNVMPGI